VISNPFRKPYVFSKKWAVWLVVGVPFILYADLTDPSAKKSDVVSTTLLALFISVLAPWVIMRMSRALMGKSPQGKTYDDDGDVIDGEVLNLNLGYRPRVRVQARLINGVVKIPDGEIAVAEIKSIKAKDPRALLAKLPFQIISLALWFLYSYFLLQPFLLVEFLELTPWLQKQFNVPLRQTHDQIYEQLLKQKIFGHKLFSHIVHSQALLQPTLIALSILILIIILKPFIVKTSLVIETIDGKRMLMPFSYSLSPHIHNYIEVKRVKRFIKKVKKVHKSSVNKESPIH
jgi:hypothetical protein